MVKLEYIHVQLNKSNELALRKKQKNMTNLTIFISNAANDTDFILTPDRDQENKNHTMNIKLYRHKSVKTIRAL